MAASLAYYSLRSVKRKASGSFKVSGRETMNVTAASSVAP